MKTLRLALPLAVLAFCAPASTVFAQDASTSRDTLLGAIAGAIIGHQNGRTAEGAVIGAGAGLLVNALSHSQGNDRGHMTGTLLGGAAGAMIGKHNGNTAAGALIGATVGYLAADSRPASYRDDRRDYYEVPRQRVIVVQPRYVERDSVIYSPSVCAEPARVVYVAPDCEPRARVVVVDTNCYAPQVVVVDSHRAVVVRQRPVVIVGEHDPVVRRDRDDWRRD